MNVKLAAQVFSESVTAVLCCLSTLGSLPSSANNTADFCSGFNDLFDSVNSRKFKHPDRPLLSAVSKGSPHLDTWTEIIEFIQSREFQTQGKKIKFPCIEGWIITLSAFKQMIPELLNTIPFIMMSRFTQDALENFFSVVRRRGGSNDHPTPTDFQCRLRMLMAQHVLNTCGSANCEPDYVSALIPVELLSSAAGSMTNDISVNDHSENSAHNVMDLALNDEVEMLCENAASYVAGYVAKVTLKKYNCDYCKSVLTGQKILSDNLILLYFKEYSVVKDGLFCPSDLWLQTVCKFGKKFDELYQKYYNSSNIKTKIIAEYNATDIALLTVMKFGNIY